MTPMLALVARGVLAGLTALVASLPAAAQAGEAAEIGSVRPVDARAIRAGAQQSPTQLVRARNRRVQEILDSRGDVEGDSLDAETRERLKDVINGLIDFRELSRRALGKYWNDRTEQEKTEFVDVFRQLIRNSSVRKLGIYRADSVVYREPEVSGDEARVTTAAYKDRKTVEIVYHMHLTDGEWKAYDVVIDEASTVRTYRDSFYNEISKTSYSAMYDRLVQKLEEEEEQSGASTSSRSPRERPALVAAGRQ